MALFQAVLIETLSSCSRACWFCKFGHPRADGVKARLDWDLIERIVFNLRDLDYRGRISWFWINEPLMDKRMHDMIYCALPSNIVRALSLH